VVGRRLIPMLIAKGHDVVATTTTPRKIEALRALGATPVVLDALDREAVIKAITDAKPEVIVHQMTALASLRNLKHFDDEFAVTNRLRTEGTEHLLAGAKNVGTKLFIAQSYCGWPSGPGGSRVKTEDEPFDPNPVKSMSKTLAAIRKLEQLVTGVNGIVLRYGNLYPAEALIEMVRKRMFPVVGDGGGVWSHLHLEDAAGAVVAAIERSVPGIYNIVDDEPAEVAVWLPELARIVGAKKPMRIPVWLARLMIGEAGVFMMTKLRGSSNAKAKRVLGWTPRYASWREGFRA